MVEGIGGASTGMQFHNPNSDISGTKKLLLDAHGQLTSLEKLNSSFNTIKEAEPDISDVDTIACHDALDRANTMIERTDHPNKNEICAAIQGAKTELTDENIMGASKNIQEAFNLL